MVRISLFGQIWDLKGKNEMDEYLKPHRDLESERQLKEIIRKIQALMHEPKNHSVIEHLLKEAAQFVKAPDRTIDLAVIEEYASWTDLDGLAGELTMEVPVLSAVSKEDFISIIQLIREVIETEQTPNDVSLNYFMDFYREFLSIHFPDIADSLFDEIFEDTSLDRLVDMAFSQT